MIVDSLSVTLTSNTISNNAFAGVLIDLSGVDGAATITLTNNTSANNNQQSNRDVVQQNVPETATVTVTNSGEGDTLERDDQVPVDRSATPPPRCGDGARDPGEYCDINEQNPAIDCTPFCLQSSGIRQITAYDRGFCAAHYNGQIQCLGQSNSGQFGANNATGQTNLLRLEQTEGYIQVALGDTRWWSATIARRCEAHDDFISVL